MKYMVNKSCWACGRCSLVCPEVFSLNDDGTAYAISEDVPKDAEDYAYDAMENCPACAIVPQD